MAAQRILVIEDEPGARDALQSLLAEDGYTVCTAASGETGLQRVRDFRPDTIVCDYYLPDIDGLEILRAVRSDYPRKTTFIVITAGGAGEETETALRREADLFFQKPVNLSTLRHALQGGAVPQRRNGGNGKRPHH